IATHCDPDDVGESWWGYQMASRLSRRLDATVLTLVKNGNPGQAASALPDARVFECADWPLGRVHERLNALLKPGYLKFHRFARRRIRALLADGEFDLIHQFTPLSMRYPSPGVGWGLPLILGPYGGSVETPPGYEADMRAMASYTRLRRIDAWRFRVDPLLRRSLSSADLVLGVAPYVRDNLAAIPLRRFEVLLQTAITELPDVGERPRDPERLRLLSVGRIIRTKGTIYLVRAMAHLNELPGVTLDIVGDGDDRALCEREAASLGVSERIRFHGKRPRSEIDGFYRRADLFVFPSLREPSGQVVLEAMSFGVPLIVMDRGGPGYTVRKEFGIRLAAGQPENLPARLADAIRELRGAPQRLAAMGAAARECIEEDYLWDRKIDRVLALYRSVLEAPERV
ncbi:MAG: glycosyltransferase family 4 protein, partial [Myxococcota bacterium]